MNLWKPYFIHRPAQILRRIVREFWKPQNASVHLPWGAPILINPRESIGRAIWETGVHEIATTEAIFRLLPKGGVGVDVGANIGYMTAAMARASGPNGTVISFEPHPAIFEKLQANADLQTRCRSAPIQLRSLALSDATGTALLSTDPRSCNQGTGTLNRMDNAHCIQVRSARMDELFPDLRIDLLKIDVEGHELNVLQGAEQMFNERRVQHVVYENHESPTGLVSQWLESHGFTTFALGWRISGPVLSKDKTSNDASAYQAPDFLATLCPDTVEKAFSSSGWLCLRKRSAL